MQKNIILDIRVTVPIKQNDSDDNYDCFDDISGVLSEIDARCVDSEIIDIKIQDCTTPKDKK